MVKARQFVVSPIDDKMRQVSARVVVDIAKPGVSLLHPESEKKIQFYPFTHIQSWLSSKQAFGLQVLDSKQEVQTLWFRTKESENIISALKGCVDEILSDRKKSATSKRIAETIIGGYLEQSPADRSNELRKVVAAATSDDDADQQRKAVWTLSLLTGVSDVCKEEILSAGHLEATLVLVRSQDPKLQCHLAGMIANCAQLDHLRLQICEMGAVRPLITLAQSGVPEVSRVAVAALAIISANALVREDLAKRGTMQLFASMMNANDDPLLQRSALAGFSALACDERFQDLLVGEGSIKSLVALAKAVCDLPGKTAELLSAQVSETIFTLSYKNEMKFDLIHHGAIPVLGVMLNRNEKRTQKFVVGAMQNLLGATGNESTAFGAEAVKLELENECAELRTATQGLQDEVEGLRMQVSQQIDADAAREQAEAIRMMASVAKDLGSQLYPEGDESIDQVIISGEEALEVLETMIANQ
eukprot:TRINITY_DN13958_c0_g2_i7.p1 TRINITY_DN13958_c0_g2~~TRINITY_DN13958_c0_g2_i7.p1  ORF type:complete len:474 (-),score=151.60 TRINITY_DN13958_c0_g2_i7:285-1706(-)